MTTDVKKEYSIEYKGYEVIAYQNKRGDFFIIKILNSNKPYKAYIYPPINCHLTLKGMTNYAKRLIESDIIGEFYKGSHIGH